MTEKELISKIIKLKEIEPRKEWVFLTKHRIFSDFEKNPVAEDIRRVRTLIGFNDLIWGLRMVFQHKYAFAFLIILVVLIGTFGFSLNSVPGDSLYSVKKIAEKGQTIFISESKEVPKNLELTNKRLDDLAKIAQNNEVNKLAPAIDEYKEKASEAAKLLSGRTETAKQEEVKEIAIQVKKIEENKEKIEALGVEIGETEELDNALALLIEREIKDLESRTLTEEQLNELEQIKQDYEAGSYSAALEKILMFNGK